MIFLETDLTIPGVDAATFPNVRYCLPINFWPENDTRLQKNIRDTLEANPQDDIAVCFDSHLFERHFSQAIPANTTAPYIAPEKCADNYERAISGLGVELHADCLRQLRKLKRGLDSKHVKWLYCRPEVGLWYQGSDPQENERWMRVREHLTLRGIGKADWGKDQWTRLTYLAFNGFLRQVLHFLGWLDPVGRDDLVYWFSNAHGDELGCHVDDWGNRVPPVHLEPEQLPNLYVFPPEQADMQLARAVNFARHKRNAVVHLRICPIPDGNGGQSTINPSDVLRRAKAVLAAGGNVALFVGDPSLPQGSSWFPPDGSTGAAILDFCKECR